MRRYRLFSFVMVAVLSVGVMAPAVAGLASPAKVLAEDPAATPAPAKPAASTPSGAVSGPPASATDESRIPHYYGPYANWGWSPQAMVDAIVTLQRAPGDTTGTGAEASATVDPKDGSVISITVTSPGSGYTLPPVVQITSPGVTPTSVAVGAARISAGVIDSISVNETGGGFTAPVVAVTGGSPTPGFVAAAVSSGSVDAFTVADGGSGYQAQPIVVFSLPELPDGVQATGAATMVNGSVAHVTLLNAGSGYTSAPTVTILDGDKVIATAATAVATMRIDKIDVTSGGQGYHAVPTVTISDTVGTPDKGASATAFVAVAGAVAGITVTKRGAGYVTPGIKKFQDTLAGLGAENANNLGQFIPVAVADVTTYPGADYYEIAVVQYRMKFSSSMPATLLRGYVQLSTDVVPGDHVPLSNENFDPTKPPTPIYLPNGQRA